QRSTLGGKLDPVDADGAAVDRLQSVDCSAQGRLAGTARTDHDDHFATMHRGGDVIQDVELTEVLIDVVDDNERIFTS
ncbi:MAG: 6-pyruvoyl-tetrahydropterin synthase, partial [Microbacteriaceae bacterium]|nr:6-pyruvoyl-tetrahydropterin synthase [Microbacteriaceae bacterium]